MAKMIPAVDYYGYKFDVVFYSDQACKNELRLSVSDGDSERPLGYSRVHHGPAGLEFWVAHVFGEKLLAARLEAAKTVDVIMLQRDTKNPARIIRYDLNSSARGLPVSLDAMANGVALDGVIFQNVHVVSVTHEVRKP